MLSPSTPSASATERSPALLGRVLAVWRLFCVLALTSYWAVRYVLARRSDPEPAACFARHARRWSLALARAVGLRVQVSGAPPRGPCILAANHCSYADVTALLSQVDAVVLAKAEVASWPILGWAARLGDTVFVARSRVRSRRRALQQLEQLYALGVSVLVFPEGTTSATWGARPFQPGIFKSAARLGARVVPVSIRYARPDDAWVGDATFVGHFLTTFARPAVEVCLSFGEPLRGEDGLSLCASAVAHIDRALGRLQPVTTDAQGAQRASEQQPQAT